MKKESNNDKMVAMLRRLRSEMHGAVVEAMEARGVRYGLNYGVAIPVVRTVAKDYAPDHELAEYLFRQDIRELKLAAVYVDDPARVTPEQMERWTAAMPADEIMEHAAMNLFYAAPDAAGVIAGWLATGDRIRRKGALHMIGRGAVKGLFDETTAGVSLSLIEKMFRGGGDPPLRASVYALTSLAAHSPKIRSAVLETAHSFAAHSDPSVRTIVEETLVLLDYTR